MTAEADLALVLDQISEASAPRPNGRGGVGGGGGCGGHFEPLGGLGGGGSTRILCEGELAVLADWPLPDSAGRAEARALACSARRARLASRARFSASCLSRSPKEGEVLMLSVAALRALCC